MLSSFAIYNNFHLILDSKNLCVPTIICLESVGTILTSLGAVDITSQEELVILLRRLYVRMARIVNDSIILLNGQREVPLIFAYEFSKIQILRTFLVRKIRFKHKINLKVMKLMPSEFNISEIFNDTTDNLFEVIKKKTTRAFCYIILNQ